MKPTNPGDLRGLSDKEMATQINESKRALTDMQFQKAVGQLENPAAIRVVRRDIARMKTILSERIILSKRKDLIERKSEN